MSLHSLVCMSECFVKEWVAYFYIVSDFMSGLRRKGDFFCLQQLLRQQVSQFIGQSVSQSPGTQLISLKVSAGSQKPFSKLNRNCWDLAVCHQKLPSVGITAHIGFLSFVSCVCVRVRALSHTFSVALLKPSFNISFEAKRSQITFDCFACKWVPSQPEDRERVCG